MKKENAKLAFLFVGITLLTAGPAAYATGDGPSPGEVVMLEVVCRNLDSSSQVSELVLQRYNVRLTERVIALGRNKEVIDNAVVSVSDPVMIFNKRRDAIAFKAQNSRIRVELIGVPGRHAEFSYSLSSKGVFIRDAEADCVKTIDRM